MPRTDEAERAKVISYNALRRARTTVEDFVQSYLPLYGLDLPAEFLRIWDILVFVEASVYEMDEENEELARRGDLQGDVTLAGEDVLLTVLEGKGLLNYNIKLQLLQGKQYWRRERELCAAMGHRGAAFTVEEVHAASEAKSFDYRLLHYLLCAILGRMADPRLFHFLFLDEHLVDIGDDLHDYEEDVVNNCFNIYRAYVQLFGENAEGKLVERISDFEARHQRALESLPAWTQAAYRRRRQEAQAVPGSEKWIIPAPILDEAAFRATAHEEGPQS